jgi:diacylglycerol kinase (ATP)
VVNPRASTGASAQLWRTTTDLLSRRATGYRELHTHGDGRDPERIAALVREEGSDLLIAAGGDGTVGAAVQALMQISAAERPTLALFPLGTANNVARSLGLMSARHGGARAIDTAVQTALGGRDRPMDVGRTGDRHFLGSIALGMDADILALRNRYTRRFPGSRLVRGYPLYLWSCAENLARVHGVSGTVTVDGVALEGNVYNLLVTNTAVYAGEFRFHCGDPSADGRLDLHLFKGAADYVSRYTAAWLRHLRHQRGKPVAGPRNLRTARRIAVDLERDVAVQIDGEELGASRSCTIFVDPNAVTVRVP